MQQSAQNPQVNPDTKGYVGMIPAPLSTPELEYSPLRGIAAAGLLTVLAAVLFGYVPYSLLFSGLLGSIMLTAWVTGTIAFACSLHAPRIEVAQAIAFRDFRQAARTPATARRAA